MKTKLTTLDLTIALLVCSFACPAFGVEGGTGPPQSRSFRSSPAIIFSQTDHMTLNFTVLAADGSTADRLKGFSGRAFGIGPIVTYSTKVGKSHLDFNARFIPEFGNENRVQGNLFQFAVSLKF